MGKDEKAVAVAAAGVVNFPALTEDPKALAAQIQEVLGNMTLRDLVQIKIPTGGALMWTIPTLEGDVAVDSVEGIVAHVQKTRAYYTKSFDETGGGVPPDCVSEDGRTGVGDPGGVCHSCPYNKFGTGKGGEGKACREIMRWFLLMPRARLPRVLNITPGSLKSAGSYLLRVLDAGFDKAAIITRAKLIKAQNKKGLIYSQAILSMVGKLTAEQFEAAKVISKAIKESIQPLPPTPDEVPEGE